MKQVASVEKENRLRRSLQRRQSHTEGHSEAALVTPAAAPRPANQWLWVTRKEYYLNADGRENKRLNPEYHPGADEWWTCHRETKAGDLVLLWRTKPKSDIRYLLQAKSDAQALDDDPELSVPGWDFACEYQSIYQFKQPVTVEELRQHPILQNLPALRGRFQGRVFRIGAPYWDTLMELSASREPEFRSLLRVLAASGVAQQIRLERELEDALAANLGRLKQHGYDLELYCDHATGATGRQLICTGIRGRIDLLCYDRKQRHYVVLELKNVLATRETYGQISSYMGWVRDKFDKPVIGLVISRGRDAMFSSAMTQPNPIYQIDLSILGFA